MSRSFASRMLYVALSAFLVAFALHSPVRADSQAMILPTDPAPLVVNTAKGPESFSIEIADTDEEEERGLMFRQTMGATHGMLFVLDATGVAAFWMKNTPMALDLVFIGQKGKIGAIRPGAPYSTDIISPKVSSRFVLELKAGTAKRMSIAVGDQVSHPAIAKIADDD